MSNQDHLNAARTRYRTAREKVQSFAGTEPITDMIHGQADWSEEKRAAYRAARDEESAAKAALDELGRAG